MPRVWVLWQQSQATHRPPSDILGLTAGSYEAYCLDQAVWYVGTTIEGELEQAGHKKQKGEGRVIAARQAVLDKYLGKTETKGQFADPAVLFGL